MKRASGRKADEMREMTAKVGVIPNADGSAMFSFGKTIAIAAVYGKTTTSAAHAEPKHRHFTRYLRFA